MYREEFPSCPACDGKLDPVGARLRCGTCEGVFVPTAELDELFAQMSPDDMRTTAARLVVDVGGPVKHCPRCHADMQTAMLEQIAVDVCAEHGVWFDANELAWVLEVDGVAFGNRNRPKDRTRHHRPPADPNRAGLPAPPPLVKSFWQKFFGTR